MIERVELWGEPGRTHYKQRGEERTLCGDAQPHQNIEHLGGGRTPGRRLDGLYCPVCQREMAKIDLRNRRGS